MGERKDRTPLVICYATYLNEDSDLFREKRIPKVEIIAKVIFVSF